MASLCTAQCLSNKTPLRHLRSHTRGSPPFLLREEVYGRDVCRWSRKDLNTEIHRISQWSFTSFWKTKTSLYTWVSFSFHASTTPSSSVVKIIFGLGDHARETTPNTCTYQQMYSEIFRIKHAPPRLYKQKIVVPFLGPKLHNGKLSIRASHN